jgi:hypothetical protein
LACRCDNPLAQRSRCASIAALQRALAAEGLKYEERRDEETQTAATRRFARPQPLAANHLPDPWTFVMKVRRF